MSQICTKQELIDAIAACDVEHFTVQIESHRATMEEPTVGPFRRTHPGETHGYMMVSWYVPAPEESIRACSKTLLEAASSPPSW